MTTNKIHKIGRIDQVLRDYFDSNKSILEIPEKNLMPLFIEKGIFTKDHSNGLPIRKILRELDAENKLDLITNAKVIRNTKNRNWYFKSI
jgi:hypothetical protein